MTNDLYMVHISLHGLIRGENLELGRDADTGGQCKYVVELVKALSQHPNVGRVDLLTRMVIDPKVSDDYAKPVEDLGGGAYIRRIAAGPRRYLRKEVLWRYVDSFVDQALALFRQTGRLPDVVHAHYGDAGYIGRQLATLLGCPFFFTGHSLGRTKRDRLLEGGASAERIDQLYNLSARIESEELSLDAASMVCTSTQQEVDEQYSDYEFYDPERMRVIPPGVDISRFAPPGKQEVPAAVVQKIERFLDHPDRPLALAIARADEKKNLATLVRAFGQSETLRDTANLVIVAGNRDEIGKLDPGARKVWTELLQLIDDYDLYGIVSIPKHHQPDEIPHFYRYAASKKGIFVNPALTEPFGLTMIEAAASGLPVLATNDGGPRDIFANCHNGMLIDPLDTDAMTVKLEDAFSDPDRWRQWAEDGLKGIMACYTWEGHVNRYLDEASELIESVSQPHQIIEKLRTSLPLQDRLIVTGLETDRLDGDAEAIAELRELLSAADTRIGFGIASGRDLDAARELVDNLKLPKPDFFITQLGAEIHYGARLVKDKSWEKHLNHRWEPEMIKRELAELPGLQLQPEQGRQHRFKISYIYDAEKAPRRRQIQKLLRKKNLQAKVLLSEGLWLDVIPQRSGKGQAIRYVALRWGIPADQLLFYARRGSDYEALSGQFLGVLGSDHASELKLSQNLPRVYCSRAHNFVGLLEGVKAYHFFDESIKVPEVAKGLEGTDDNEDEALLSTDVMVHTSEEE